MFRVLHFFMVNYFLSGNIAKTNIRPTGGDIINRGPFICLQNPALFPTMFTVSSPRLSQFFFSLTLYVQFIISIICDRFLKKGITTRMKQHKNRLVKKEQQTKICCINCYLSCIAHQQSVYIYITYYHNIFTRYLFGDNYNVYMHNVFEIWILKTTQKSFDNLCLGKLIDVF